MSNAIGSASSLHKQATTDKIVNAGLTPHPIFRFQKVKKCTVTTTRALSRFLLRSLSLLRTPRSIWRAESVQVIRPQRNRGSGWLPARCRWDRHLVDAFHRMLSFHLPIQVAFDLPITLLSMIIAIAASAIALFSCAKPTRIRNLIISTY